MARTFKKNIEEKSELINLLPEHVKKSEGLTDMQKVMLAALKFKYTKLKEERKLQRDGSFFITDKDLSLITHIKDKGTISHARLILKDKGYINYISGNSRTHTATSYSINHDMLDNHIRSISDLFLYVHDLREELTNELKQIKELLSCRNYSPTDMGVGQNTLPNITDNTENLENTALSVEPLDDAVLSVGGISDDMEMKKEIKKDKINSQLESDYIQPDSLRLFHGSGATMKMCDEQNSTVRDRFSLATIDGVQKEPSDASISAVRENNGIAESESKDYSLQQKEPCDKAGVDFALIPVGNSLNQGCSSFGLSAFDGVRSLGLTNEDIKCKLEDWLTRLSNAKESDLSNEYNGFFNWLMGEDADYIEVIKAKTIYQREFDLRVSAINSINAEQAPDASNKQRIIGLIDLSQVSGANRDNQNEVAEDSTSVPTPDEITSDDHTLCMLKPEEEQLGHDEKYTQLVEEIMERIEDVASQEDEIDAFHSKWTFDTWLREQHLSETDRVRFQQLCDGLVLDNFGMKLKYKDDTPLEPKYYEYADQRAFLDALGNWNKTYRPEIIKVR